MRRIILTTILTLVLYSVYSQKSERQYMSDAEKVAIDWLNKLNNKKYNQCWYMLDKTTKDKTNFDDWNTYFRAELMPELGDFIDRKYYLAEIETEVENLPKGLYVSVHYTSNYSNTQTASEFILLGLTKPEGRWHVLSYFAEYQLINDAGDLPD